METGKVVEIIGAVIDVQFPREAMPNIFDALLIEDGDLTLEVQQQIGDGIVRTIAMGTTDGLKRGLDVKNTGAPISVPVGDKTCLLYTSPSPRDRTRSRMPSSA